MNTTVQFQSLTQRITGRIFSECTVKLKNTANPPLPRLILISSDSRLPLNFTTRYHLLFAYKPQTCRCESLATHTTPGADHRPRLIRPMKEARTCWSQPHPTTTPAKCGTFYPSTRRIGVASGEFVAAWDMQACPVDLIEGTSMRPGAITASREDWEAHRHYSMPIHTPGDFGQLPGVGYIAFGLSSSRQVPTPPSASLLILGLHISGLQAVNHLRHRHSIAVVAPDPPPDHRFWI